MQSLPIGVKVNTELGVFEIIDYDNVEDSYFCYQQGFYGHSGTARFGEKYLNTKYDGNCWWFFENEVTLIEENKVSSTKHNYREIKPTDMVKVCIGDNEFEVPLGDLVHATAVLGVTNGSYGFRLWNALTKALGKDGFVDDLETLIEFRDKQKEALDYFFKPQCDKQKQKDELSNLILSKQKELNQLIDTLNQM